MTRRIRIWRILCALLLSFFASTALASAAIAVNKAFAPNSVALGGTSVVTVTLQNDSPAAAANITTFSDDIGTTMAGKATLLSSPSPTTTCSGGTPTVVGQVLTMNNGQIPMAPSVSTPGSCTITFSVSGAAAGNGFNTIYAANVVTNLGSPTADVTQTLSVQSANVTDTSSTLGIVQTGDTNTVTFVLTNPAVVALTSAAFPITSSASLSYTISGYTTSCGGTASLPAAGTSGTANFSGLTIPAGGTCTVTLNVATPNVTTVTLALASSAITNVQGSTDATGTSTTAKFTSGQPTVTKTFSPTAVVAGGTTTLTLNVQNTLVSKPLTNAAISDTLPAGLTISGSPTANSYCGSPTLGGSGSATLTFSGGTIAASHTCTITATVASTTAGALTNSIPAANFTSTEATGATGTATAPLVVVAGGGGLTTSASVQTASVQMNVADKITLNFVSVGAALTGGTFTDVLPQSLQPMVALTDAGHLPAFSGCGSSSPTVTFGGSGGNTTVSGSNLAIASAGTCSVSFYVQFTSPTATTKIDTNVLPKSMVSFNIGSVAVSPFLDASVNVSQVPTFSITNYLASNSGLVNQPLTVAATIYDSTATSDTNAVAVINLTPGKVQLATVPNFTFSGCPAGLTAAGISVAGNREQFTATLGSINATCTIGYDVVDELGAVLSPTAPASSTYSSTLTGNSPIPSTATNNVAFATTTVNLTKAFSPNQLQSGGIATADVTLTVPQAGSLANTQANGIAFSD
ncbi:MAG: DUF11 domain-containing protein, partial [Candidatus Eremiobacteraeota bacterium]|nr:DUF11 domain-containing protein [Candidatus Eremiobacteraeota bacterium]